MRFPKPTRVRKRNAIKRDLDTIVSRFVKWVYGDRCVICGRSGGAIHWHHWAIKRTSLSTRWHPRNGVALCYRCHQIQDTAEGQDALREALDRLHGDGWSEVTAVEQRMLARKPFPLKTFELQIGLASARTFLGALCARPREEVLRDVFSTHGYVEGLPWWLGGEAPEEEEE